MTHTSSMTTLALRFTPVIIWMGLIFALSAQPTTPHLPGFMPSLTAILGHFVVYAVLAALLWWLLGVFELSVRQRWFIAFAVAVCYGMSDEWHQEFVPSRDPSILDLAVDAAGALASLAVILLLTNARADQPMQTT